MNANAKTVIFETARLRLVQNTSPNDFSFERPDGELVQALGPGYGVMELTREFRILDKAIARRGWA